MCVLLVYVSDTYLAQTAKHNKCILVGLDQSGEATLRGRLLRQARRRDKAEGRHRCAQLVHEDAARG